MPIQIELAESDEQIAACFETMAFLRPHLAREGFVRRVRAQAEQGYRLAALREDGEAAVRCVAGFRVLRQLAYGDVLYVDDLSTAEDDRSRGYGNAMFGWLVEYAGRLGLDELQLDSGVQRHGAHRFYFRERMHIHAYHFRLAL
jgi:GNAT superfamily N-acetyltransferase